MYLKPMFGNPSWFRAKRVGWGLVPVSWQGWVYTVVWSGALVLPFLILLSIARVPEALIWLTASIAALCWDVAQVRREMEKRVDVEVEFVDEPSHEASHIATRHFDLRLRH